MNDYHTELLRKFLDSRCSPDELKQVRYLLQLAENRELLDQLIAEQTAAEWDNTGYADGELKPTIARLKNKLNHRIYGQAEPAVRLLWKSSNVAAVITGMILSVGIFLWFFKKKATEPAYIVHQNTLGPPHRYLLPDSTVIYLAAGGKIRYPQQFSGKTRPVFLEGEAFFDVKRNPQKPFIIQTQEVQTRVLGTSFRVSTYRKAAVEVAVASGTVEVLDLQKGKTMKLATLTKGLKISYDPVTGSLERGTTDPAALKKWTTGEVYFEEQPLDRIAEELQHIYGVKVRLERPALANCRVSAAFLVTEPLQSVLEMLALVGKFRYTFDIKNQVYYLF